jgi:hypothetical protein
MGFFSIRGCEENMKVNYGVYMIALFAFFCTFLPYSYAGSIKFNPDGSFFLEGQGLPKVKGSLFLWHDDWKYATPSSVTSTEPDSWSGNMPEPNITTGYISYTQTTKTSEDGTTDISLDFRKNGEIRLTRGIFMLIEFPTYDMSGQTIDFTHGLPYVASDDYKTVARGFSVNLNESTALEVSFDRACIFEHRGKMGESLMNIRLSPDANAKVNVKLRFKPTIDVTTTWQAEPHEEKLAINNVALSAEQVPRYSILELIVNLSANYYDCFDPDNIELEAIFTSPSGSKINVPGFIYQGFKAENEGDLELLTRDGGLVWKIRFAPTEIGDYSLIVNAKDKSGRTKSDEKKFACVASESKGFVKIGTPPAKGAPIYFLLDNGETLFLIGHNMPTYYPDVEEYFKKMESTGENYNRFWMYSTALGLEWGQPVGYYRLDEAWKLDKALEAASRHGIYIMLCFDTHQDFRENWENNPYNIKLGGPIRKPLDFFKDLSTRKLYKKRLHYMVARWSAYTNILAWEFMNEMEGWDGAEQSKAVVTKWIIEMSKELRTLDPYKHPISSSLWTTAGWSELWKLPEIDFVQSHFYANKPMDMAQEVANTCDQKRTDYTDKLHVFAEYGIMSGSGTAENDPTGVHLHNGNWAGLMSGSASVPASWWHEAYIDPLNLYGVYRGIANYLADEKDLAKYAWKPLSISSFSYIQPPENLSYKDLQFVGKGNNWQTPSKTTFTVGEDGKISDIELMPSQLHGKTHIKFKAPLKFQVNYPTDGKFIIRVGRVGDKGLLKVMLDGKEVASVDLPTGKDLGVSSEYVKEWKRWETIYNKDVEINMPAGKHEIQIQNDGNDWITIDNIRLTNYVTNAKPDLRVLGMQTSDRALIWVQNKSHTWFNIRDKVTILPVPSTKLTLSGFTNGDYKLELWDTVKGSIIEQKELSVSDGTLSLELSEVKQDYAIKIKRGI